ncbi:MAG: SPOR domain-containing protein [Sulfurovum sp.]
MHDHNLDDLIIGTVPTENTKTKSFLTIVALLIVVMIVAIVLTKILLKTPDNNTLALEENMTEMIAPELKLQEAAKEPEPAKEPSLSSMIEGETPPPPAQESLAKEVVPAPQDTSAQAQQSPTQTNTSDVVSKESEVKDEDIQEAEAGLDEAVEITDEYTQTAQEKKKTVEEKKSQEVVHTPVPAKKTVTKPTAPKPVAVKPTSTQTYYIQVGSFTTDPSARFLSSIQNSGFSYTIAAGGANGAKKLLIGPYPDRASADRALANVKDRINKIAFVTKK